MVLDTERLRRQVYRALVSELVGAPYAGEAAHLPCGEAIARPRDRPGRGGGHDVTPGRGPSCSLMALSRASRSSATSVSSRSSGGISQCKPGSVAARAGMAR